MQCALGLGGLVAMARSLIFFKRLVWGLLIAHLGGLLLLALSLSVEGVPLSEWQERLPGGWASVSAALTLLGCNWAAFQLRREGVLLALGSLGLSPYRILPSALLLGSLIGLPSSFALQKAPQQGEWVRAEGGWWHNGQAMPDPDLLAPLAPPPVPRLPIEETLSGALAALCGCLLGFYRGALASLISTGLLVVGMALARGLLERGFPTAPLPALGLLLLGLGLWVLAPLFPRRFA